MTDSKLDHNIPEPRELVDAIMQHEGVDEQEATHRLLERLHGELRPAPAAEVQPAEKTTAARIQAMRTAAEIAEADADAYLAPIEGVDYTPSKLDVDYRGPYSLGQLLTVIADHVEDLPAPVVAWAITVAEAIIDGDEGVTKCRFCKCTEDMACPGGCGWATDEQLRAVGIEPMEGDVCTECVRKKEVGILEPAAA